jgi:ribosomal protein L12E/L44/L45/RPP1/RPP2
LLPSLVTLYELLKEQMRQLSTLPGARAAHSAKMQRKNPQHAHKSSHVSSDSDEEEEMDVDEGPVNAIKGILFKMASRTII